MKRLVLGGVLLVVAAVAVIAGVGAALPQSHSASAAITVNVAPERVFLVVSDVARYPEWRSNVSRVEMLGESPTRWREHDGSDAIAFEVLESAPPSRWRVRIADPDLPFGGTWTYSIDTSPEGTRITITEDGEVYNPVFRFVSRFVIGHTATIGAYLADLRRRLGEVP
jgi:uncharacterized protein YndB with AHSA1/START domain